MIAIKVVSSGSKAASKGAIQKGSSCFDTGLRLDAARTHITDMHRVGFRPPQLGHIDWRRDDEEIRKTHFAQKDLLGY